MTLTLDLAALGDNDGHVLIPTFPGNGQPYSVTLGWTGKTPSGDIPLTLPPQNVSNPASEQARFVIPNAHLQSIAGGSAAVRYTLVQNGVPADRESETTNVTVTSLPVVLTAPLVVEANGTLVLDLAQISGSAVTVMIAAWVGQRAGDRVILNWAGTPQVFNPETPFAPVDYTDEYVVQPGAEQDPITFSVLLEYLTPLGGGTLQVSYQVVFKASGDTRSSPLMTYSVIAAALALPLPVVVESANGQVAPMRVLNGANVQISYPGALATDAVALLWNKKTDAVSWQNGAETLTFTVPPAEIAPVIGKTIEVQYAVQRGTTWSTSPVLILTVLPLMEGDFKMPKVTHATDGSLGLLDLSTFEGDTEIVIEPWPFIKEGQTVWLDMVSEVETLSILTAHPVTAPEAIIGIKRPIYREKLDLIPDMGTITFPGKMQFDESSSTVGASSFPLLKLNLLKLGRSGFEDFRQYEMGEFSPNFDTAGILFTGGEGNLHHEIIAFAGGKAISLQSGHGPAAPAQMTFKGELKPSLVIFDIDVFGENERNENLCIVTCYSSEDPISTSIKIGAHTTLIHERKGITHFTFENLSQGFSSYFVASVLANIRWERN